MGPGGGAGLLAGARAAAGPVGGHRRREPGQRAPRRGGVRGRVDARRPAQAMAHARPQGLSRRVRLLVHGLRDRRRPGREAGRPRPGGVRPGRRRVVPDDGPGAGDRGPGGHPADHRAGGQPRACVHRVAVAVRRVPAVRHRLPVPRPGHRAARRAGAADRLRRQRAEPGRPRAAGALGQRAGRRAGRRPRRARAGRHHDRDRPAGARAGQRGVVGRACRAGIGAGLHRAGPGRL